MRWAFGFSRHAGVHNLCDENRAALFFASAHTGVIYDLNSKKQKLLQGHCNLISCTSASRDRRYIATADRGPESMVVIWDTYSGTPIQTIANPHEGGVAVMDMSSDARYLVTISDGQGPQVLSIWDIKTADQGPIHSAQVCTADDSEASAERQICVRFDQTDVHSIVSNGESLVVFWSWADDKLTYYAPPLSQRDFKQPVGALTKSIFIPNSGRAASVTVDGDALLWSCVDLPEVSSTDRRATKLVKLHSDAVRFMDVVGDMVVTGGADGHVRFFDKEFRVVAWFEDLDAGPVSSISFAHQPKAFAPAEHGKLACPDFVVATENSLVVGCHAAMFDELTAEARRGTLLVQGQDAAVHGLAAHPRLPRFACAGHSGLLQLWDYSEKRMLLLRMFDKLLGQTLAFSPGDGKLLAIGFTNGTIKILDGTTLQEGVTFRECTGCVTHLAFSSDGVFLAAADTDRAVALFRFGAFNEESGTAEWEYLGKYRAHHSLISDLIFSSNDEEGAEPRLFSLGEDRRMVEYDVMHSTVSDGVQLLKTARIEQSAVPTACVWLGAQMGGEPCIAVVNDGYKIRSLLADDMAVKKTTLGPTYGGALTKMLMLPNELGDATTLLPTRHMAYATHEKVIGIAKLPFDGNPNKAMGLIAHPGELTGLAVSWDGKWLLTAGGDDLAVHLWQVEPSAMEVTIRAAGGNGIAPFEAQLDGGKEGDAYQEMVDYFYYAQLRAQGEDSTEPRRITGRVPLTELGNLMRAVGYYPSERELEEIMQEVRMSRAAIEQQDDTIGFEDFLRLYINHRPVLGISKEQIEEALKTLGGAKLGRDELMRMLQVQGEALTPDDLAQCLRALVGVADIEQICPSQVDSKSFAEGVLGFEDYA